MEQQQTVSTILSYPFRRQHPLEPAAQLPPFLEKNIAGQVQLYNGRVVWLVTRYEDVRSILQDVRFSNDINNAGYPKLTPGDGAAHNTNVSFLHTDGSQHRKLRSMISHHFTPRAMEELRPLVHEITDQLIVDLLNKGSPADLLEAIGRPLPTLVICHLLGVPYEKHVFFEECVRISISAKAMPDEKRKVSESLRRYLEELVKLRIKEPSRDLIGSLVTDYLAQGALTFEDVVSTAQVMLIGGLETTTNAIGLTFLELQRHAGAWQELGSEPELVPQAMEELLRFQSIFDIGLTRVANEDVTLGCGSRVRAGDGVVLVLTSANRDPAMFDCPDQLQLDRKPCPHLAFGAGAHYCIGHSLARLELQVVFTELTRRLPSLRPALPVEEIRFKHDIFMYGPHTLPVAW